MRRDALNGGGRAHPASEGLTGKLAALADLDAASLRTEWRRLYRSHPPRHIRRDLLVLAIAWKLQERVHGGLTAAQKRRLANIGEELRKNGDLSASPAIRMKPGLRLVREWRGETHTVLVLEDGFEWNGQRRCSLSAIAREITGTRWSGPLFFGLKPRPMPFGGEARADG